MIKSKEQQGLIIPKDYAEYNPATFKPFDRFIMCDAAYVLANIKPKTFDFLPGKQFIAFDTETFFTGIPANRMPVDVVRRYIENKSGADIPNDFPFCISISDGEHSFVVYDSIQNKFSEMKKLEPLLTDMAIDKIAHNTNYDQHMLANSKVRLRGRRHDTLYISKLVRGNAFTHRLFDIAKEADAITLLDATGAERKPYNPVLVYERMLDAMKSRLGIKDYRQFPQELMVQYTAADTWNAMVVFEYLYKMLLDNEMVDLYDKECMVGHIAYMAERIGIPIDPNYKDVLIPELSAEVDAAEAKIYETAGGMFNINSGAQLAGVLTELGYAKNIKYSPPTAKMLEKGQLKGNPCFDKFEMERLENEGVPLIEHIQLYKSSQKLLTTFATKIYNMADGASRIHCNFKTMEAKTGRFSISNPSMQNMPRRKDARVRGAFIAEEGYTLFDFDFKSQEALVLAHYSRAAYLLEMVNAGHDIHKATASIVYSKDIADVTKTERDAAKSVGFAITYGAGAAKVSNMTGMSVLEAKTIINTYMRNIPEVDIFIKTANKVMKERGFIRTYEGRRIYAERGREYACVNYVIQGSSAGSTKSRMIKIYKFLQANKYKSKIVLQIHDSLNGMIANDEIEELVPYWKWLQTDRDSFRVTVVVDTAVCKPTWRDKKDIDIKEVKPPDEMLQRMEDYDIWQEYNF